MEKTAASMGDRDSIDSLELRGLNYTLSVSAQPPRYPVFLFFVLFFFFKFVRVFLLPDESGRCETRFPFSQDDRPF